MILTPLWHTEFLVDIKNTTGDNVRILVDAWLSDFAVWDLMERTVKVEIDVNALETIDAIYISHSHTDHFDPYTLVEIYKYARPILLLPFTLAYLIPLIREYLGEIVIEILYPKKTYFLKGIEVTWYMFSQSQITNEDDVMMLALSNTRELLFAEIDTLPDETDAGVQNELYRILSKGEHETVCYLATRNCLDGVLPILDIAPNKRAWFIREYKATQKEEIHFSYEKYAYEEYVDIENIYTIPGFVRGFIGQGIAYPSELSHDLFSLQVFPLDEIASLHADIARTSGYDFSEKALLPGRQYKIENWAIETGRKECPIAKLTVNNENSRKETGDIRIYAQGPLFSREPPHLEDTEKRILDILNQRFLPYWSANPVASFREALIKNNGVYRIGLRMTPNEWRLIFEYSLTYWVFREICYTEGMSIDEEYWLDDILDFLDGKQELYSNFWHKLDSKKVYRLWTCLGANFCNNDLVINKYRFHFERAISGKTEKDYFKSLSFF